MLTQRVGQRSRAPEEDAAIPIVIACLEESSRGRGVRFLGEAAHSQGLALSARAGLDVPVAGLGASRADAQHHNIFAGGGDLDSSVESRGIAAHPRSRDRRETSRDGVGIVTKQKACRQSNRGRCIAPDGLSDDLLR